MSDEPLLRRLTVVGIWLLAVNGMIGAGIFGVGAEAARLTGALSPWMFLLCGVLMTPIILTFGEAARHFDGTGGPILYAQTAFGPFVGFQTGWAFYVARATAFAANVNLLVSALAFFWHGADEGATRALLLVLICGG
ncbi:MAG: APC family permease [Gammaproteobacteria bacterium]|nr:APC family permease [Gammaproteobacteria bacterium]